MDAGFYQGLTGEIVTPIDPKYSEARQEWNRAIQKFPLVIVYCSRKQDVSNAIRWARKHEIPIRIRSGGHHYEGYSTGNYVLVIDISRLNRVKIDEHNGTLTMHGGASNQQLYNAVGKAGYPFPGGTCPTVGVAGYTLGGGWGYSTRFFGLGCDSLIELEIVDYTGKLLKANEDENEDLFWACRGAGGGNFGVVVSMTFSLPPKLNEVTLVEIYAPNASKETMIDFLNTWQNWLRGLDDRMTLVASIYQSKAEGMAIYGRGLFFGGCEEAKELLEPFQDIEGMQFFLEDLSFNEAMDKVQASYPPSEKFKSTGRFVYRHYNRRELEGIVDIIQKTAPGSVYAAISVYALGGKVQAFGKRETAFYYRDARYIMGIQSVWEQDQYAEKNIRWVEDRFQYIKNITTGSYINFPYSELKDYEIAYYGQNAGRLNRINKKYDPYNVFRFPQAIR
ncbi:FAD-binding oxidoreductase [Falsibacillus pallidus]|uniref:FAD-binding oxidoreductase n=1 Tax=Falsibacillus pallidus TaxID=493781 RepID=UPI003D97C8D0